MVPYPKIARSFGTNRHPITLSYGCNLILPVVVSAVLGVVAVFEVVAAAAIAVVVGSSVGELPAVAVLPTVAVSAAQFVAVDALPTSFVAPAGPSAEQLTVVVVIAVAKIRKVIYRIVL